MSIVLTQVKRGSCRYKIVTVAIHPNESHHLRVSVCVLGVDTTEVATVVQFNGQEISLRKSFRRRLDYSDETKTHFFQLLRGTDRSEVAVSTDNTLFLFCPRLQQSF
jgi:hypothetical protein